MSTDLDSTKGRPVVSALLLAIFMLGMGLRLYNLDAQTLSLDEFRTGIRAQLDLQSLVTRLASGEGEGVQLPLMYIVTHTFVALFGNSDFVLRLQAMLFGSLSILLVYEAGQILWSKEVGLIAAFLLAVNAYHVNYSQVARHYGLMVFLALLSLIFLLKALQKNQVRLWIGFILSTSLSLYNHYFAFLLLPAEVAFATWVIGENWLTLRRNDASSLDGDFPRRLSTPVRQALVFSASLALIGVSYIAWLSPLQTLASSQVASQPVAVSLTRLQLSLDFLRTVIGDYGSAHGVTSALWLVLFLLGLATSAPKTIALVLLWMGVPFAFLSCTAPEHVLRSRYVLFILSLYLLVVAGGMTTVSQLLVQALAAAEDHLRRRLALSALLTVIIFGGLSVVPLRRYYARESPDWRGAALHLRANIRTGDLILAAGGGPSRGQGVRTRLALSYYLGRGGMSTPPIVPADRGLWRPVVEQAAQGSGEVWGVFYSGGSAPTGQTEDEIATADFGGISIIHLRKASGNLLQDTVSVQHALLDLLPTSDVQFEVRLALAQIYLRTGRFEAARSHLDMASELTPDTPRASRHLARTRDEFDQLTRATHDDVHSHLWRSLALQVALVGYDLGTPSVPVGGTVNVSLWWEALDKMERDYTSFIHVVGPDERIWAQQDTLLQDGNDPTSTWELGKTVREEYELQLPPDTPPGAYIAQAGVYYWETAERLPVWDELLRREADDAITLANIIVTE